MIGGNNQRSSGPDRLQRTLVVVSRQEQHLGAIGRLQGGQIDQRREVAAADQGRRLRGRKRKVGGGLGEGMDEVVYVGVNPRFHRAAVLLQGFFGADDEPVRP